MQLINDLPLSYFDSVNGISLTDAELIDAVTQYLDKRGIAANLQSFFNMARDDQIFTIKPTE